MIEGIQYKFGSKTILLLHPAILYRKITPDQAKEEE
jgi:hypothetical protein